MHWRSFELKEWYSFSSNNLRSFSCRLECFKNDHLKDIPWEKIFSLSVSAITSENCKWDHVKDYVHIPQKKHHVKPYRFPFFLATCPAAITRSNHFFRLYQQNKYASETKFRQTRNCCRMVLQSNKHYAYKYLSPPRNLFLITFSDWQIFLSTKTYLLFNSLSSTYDKTKLIAGSFSGHSNHSNLDNVVALYLLLPSKT